MGINSLGEEPAKSNKNIKKIEYMAYLFMIFVGGSFPAIGVVIDDIANSLNVQLSVAVASYSIFTLASTIMIFATTGLVLEYLSLKKTTLLSCILLFFGIGTILISSNLFIFNIALFVYGIGYGMCFSLGYYYVILVTSNKSRAYKMALISLIYAVGAAVAPKVFDFLLNHGISWNITLSSFVIFIILAFILALFTNFNIQKEEKNPHLKAAKTWIEEIKSWHLSVYLMCFALMFYVIAETIVIFWLPVLGNREMGMTTGMATNLAAIFWGSIIIGRFIATIVLRKMKQETYICLICTLSGILLIFMALVPMSYILAYAATSITGMCFAAAYSTIASTGTTQVPCATNKLTTAILGSGAIGTIIAPLTSSYIESIMGLRVVFVSGALFMLLITVILLIVLTKNKIRLHNQQREESII
jgi:fucose permease